MAGALGSRLWMLSPLRPRRCGRPALGRRCFGNTSVVSPHARAAQVYRYRTAATSRCRRGGGALGMTGTQPAAQPVCTTQKCTYIASRQDVEECKFLVCTKIVLYTPPCGSHIHWIDAPANGPVCLRCCVYDVASWGIARGLEPGCANEPLRTSATWDGCRFDVVLCTRSAGA